MWPAAQTVRSEPGQSCKVGNQNGERRPRSVRRTYGSALELSSNCTRRPVGGITRTSPVKTVVTYSGICTDACFASEGHIRTASDDLSGRSLVQTEDHAFLLLTSQALTPMIERILALSASSLFRKSSTLTRGTLTMAIIWISHRV